MGQILSPAELRFFLSDAFLVKATLCVNIEMIITPVCSF